MRRIPALLVAALLAAAPASAAAGPSRETTTSSTVDHFEWSTARSPLGMSVTSLTPELREVFGAPADRGVLVGHVEPGTPAAAAGLTVGDVVVRIHGRPIAQPRDVLIAIDGLAKGQHVAIDLVRDRQARSIDATVSDAVPALELGELREWLMPFGPDRALPSSFDDADWFRDWWGPFEPRPTAMPAWLCKLRALTMPSRPDLICRRA